MVEQCKSRVYYQQYKQNHFSIKKRKNNIGLHILFSLLPSAPARQAIFLPEFKLVYQPASTSFLGILHGSKDYTNRISRGMKKMSHLLKCRNKIKQAFASNIAVLKRFVQYIFILHLSQFSNYSLLLFRRIAI